MNSERPNTPFRRFRRPRMPAASTARGVFWLGVAAVLLYLLVLSDFGMLRRWQLAREAEAIEARIEELQAREESLTSEEGRLEDDAYLERIAREQHGMMREGEHVYHLAPPDTTGGGGRP